jgi:hypothetical protein
VIAIVAILAVVASVAVFSEVTDQMRRDADGRLDAHAVTSPPTSGGSSRRLRATSG